MSDIPSPITRKDQYLSYLTGNTDYYPTDPITREEKYLFYLCENGGIGGGSVTPEQIQQAVDAYLEENPVQPGATVEQVAQIEETNSELVDVRVGADGKTYTSAGDAVREQNSAISADIFSIMEEKKI